MDWILFLLCSDAAYEFWILNCCNKEEHVLRTHQTILLRCKGAKCWGGGGLNCGPSGVSNHLVFILGEKLWEVQCESPTFTVAWHPKRPLLAFACDDKDGKYDNSREAGTVKLFGLPNDS